VLSQQLHSELDLRIRCGLRDYAIPAQLSARLTGVQPIHLRVVGFILINPAANNTPVMVARTVEALND